MARTRGNRGTRRGPRRGRAPANRRGRRGPARGRNAPGRRRGGGGVRALAMAVKSMSLNGGRNRPRRGGALQNRAVGVSLPT